MGTKSKPGKFDCYEKAEPDEPMFVLLARDPLAAEVVRAWVEFARHDGIHEEKIAEAEECADLMDAWREEREGFKPR